MKYKLLDLMCCPTCRADLKLEAATETSGEVESGTLACTGCASSYPIINFIPRFVPAENYANNFGFQWNAFRKTQLDSSTGLPLSRERFLLSTGWTPEELPGKLVLDVGCGAGRFTEVALSLGGEVVSLDFSTAVDACLGNFGLQPRLHIIQGSVYQLPFKKGLFDRVYCLGVLQHTPDVEGAFFALPEQLREGGKLAVDVYYKTFLNFFWPKYWLRPFTKRMPQDRLFRFVQGMVKVLLPISLCVGRIPVVGRKLRYAIPVCNYEPDFPLTKKQLREWAVLDTFDMLAPQYDYPQSARTLRGWFEQAHLQKVYVFRKGAVIGQGMKCMDGNGKHH
jgi:uncharacterized protein YbaR (Trm112 family)